MNMRFILLLLALGLSGCATHYPAPVAETPPARIEAPGPGGAAAAPGAVAEKLYTVGKGETLYSIARKYGVAPRDLAAWNYLTDTTQLKTGQQLRVTPPSSAAAPALPAGAAEVRPIETGGPVAARPLDGGDMGVAAVAPAPIFSGDAGKIKTTPKGGKLPYSEENLALLKAREGGAATAAPGPANAAVPEKPASAPASPSAPGANEVSWAWPAPGKVIANFSEGGNGAEATKGIDIAGKTGDPVLAAAEGKVVYVGNGLRGYGNLVIVKHTTDFLSAYAHNSRILVKEGQTVKRGQKIAEFGDSDADQPKLHFEVRHQGKPTDPLKYLPAR
jgi:lipoprotein NlpD